MIYLPQRPVPAAPTGDWFAQNAPAETSTPAAATPTATPSPNGQRWDQITTIVPKGIGPFKSWVESSIDALKSAKNFKFDDVESCLYFAEKHNGFGYLLHKPILSPYLWCGTNLYVKGGYVTDGVYDPNYVIKNTGCVPIILRFSEFIKLT